MTDAREVWPQVVRDASDAVELDQLGQALVRALAELGARAVDEPSRGSLQAILEGAVRHLAAVADGEKDLARNEALERSDSIVQGLTTSLWLLEMDDVPQAQVALRHTLASARRMMQDLLDDDRTSIAPGSLQRSRPAAGCGVAPGTPSSPTGTAGPLRVVVADDCEDIRMLMDVRLRRVPGVEVVALACDGLEAIAAVDTHDPDVVLMDLSMPRLDGLQATAHIRARHPRVRVVVVTGHPRAAVEVEATAAGATAVMEKGDSFEDLLRQVRGASLAGPGPPPDR